MFYWIPPHLSCHTNCRTQFPVATEEIGLYKRTCISQYCDIADRSRSISASFTNAFSLPRMRKPMYAHGDMQKIDAVARDIAQMGVVLYSATG